MVDAASTFLRFFGSFGFDYGGKDSWEIGSGFSSSSLTMGWVFSTSRKTVVAKV